jgi:monofunctional biosynthetic peptidoglycan transglycosylase
MRKIKLWLERLWVIAMAVLLVYLCNQPDIDQLQKHNPTTTALMELRVRQARDLGKDYPTTMIWKNLDEISPNLVHAVLLSEDDQFYNHHGFDLEEIKQAIKVNWAKKRFAYGGSTITQQLARTLYLSPKKNIIRKLKEALITVRLERSLSKRRILEIYLNVIEWGRGIYGAEAAARFYFNKSAADLTSDEAVALASILPSPRRWTPMGEQAFMARRRTRLLERMQAAGYLPNYVPNGPTLDTVAPAVINPDGIQGELHVYAPDSFSVPDISKPPLSDGESLPDTSTVTDNGDDEEKTQ